jgi:hypothetical protein
MSTPAQSAAAVPAAVQVLQLGTAYWTSRALWAVVELGVADHLRNGARNVKELAAATETDAGALYRVLRALAGAGLFTETEPGRFALTATGQCLRADAPDSVKNFLAFAGDHIHWSSYEQILHSVRTGQPAADAALGKPIFNYLADNPEDAARFDRAMTDVSRVFERAIVAAYDFSACRTIADIGGGVGRLLSAILEKAPGSRGILFDRGHVLDRARGLSSRIGLRRGDFFQSIPEGADLYYMRSIIHDWDDEHALAILRNCRKAMARTARLLVMEMTVPVGDQPDLSKVLDLEMLLLPGGRERTEQEFGDLLAKAGFTLERIIRTKSPVALLEAAPV